MSEPIPVEVGKKYNKLTIVKEVDRYVQPNGRTRRRAQVVCDCGKELVVMLENLYAGYSKSCGCAAILHGLTGSKFMCVHTNMKARCKNPQHPNFPDYGARGIKYDPRWESLAEFATDMLESYKEGLTLDRIDVNGNYEKSNCRWVGYGVQGHNKRKKVGCEFPYKGIRYNPNKTRFVASINSEYLSTFDVLEDAAKAYDDASQILYGDRPNGTTECLDDIYKVVSETIERKKLKEKLND